MVKWEELDAVEDDWDGEGAPRPSPEAIRIGREIALAATRQGLAISSIEADVVGGVDVYLYNKSAKQAVWCFCRNDGQVTFVYEGDGIVIW